MEIPAYRPFYIGSCNALRDEIARLGLQIPVQENLEVLARPCEIGSRQSPNRFCAQPVSGNDRRPDGSPGERSFRRYQQLAAGGFGLIWMEATSVSEADSSCRPCINPHTVSAFRQLVESVRRIAREEWQHDPVLILQLSPLPVEANLPGEREILQLQKEVLAGATLAREAGFDGIDLQASHHSLAARLLVADERSGKFGGPLENRMRFLIETLHAIKNRHPEMLLAVRLNAYHGLRHPGGFGVSSIDYRQPDLTEPLELVRKLGEVGLGLLNVTCNSPALQVPAKERGLHCREDAEPPDEHPLMSLSRQIRLAGELRDAMPGIPVVGSGFAWLRQFAPQVGAGAMDHGAMDFLGMGRGALAYPDAPAQVLRGGGMEAGKSCMVCYACSSLYQQGEPVGCPIRDPASATVYQLAARYSSETLAAGARRCHQCEAAPCIAACPTQVNIPAFIAAYLAGNQDQAYEIIRQADPLPELTSHLSPGWLQAEGACIETALTGTPVPILDLQYAISWMARDKGATAIRLPQAATGKQVAVIGAGPSGLAASIRLLEQGHRVELFEKARRWGGTPERLIPASRFPGAEAELEAILQPALESGRLVFRTGFDFGEQVGLEELQKSHDAVLLAVGLWKEGGLSAAPGVMDALSFLEKAKAGELRTVPKRAAILAGGDCAMDSGRMLQALGACQIFVIFEGPRSAMHWHMPESWFATPGVQAMMSWKPLEYVLAESGSLEGVRLRHSELDVESVLPVGLVIEAMGLQIAPEIRQALTGLAFHSNGLLRVDPDGRTTLDGVFAAGGLVNGGASVGQCVAEGLRAAQAIHQFLS